ncbi:MAG: putative Fe-S protein YdhL (DUF1289 family) [Bacteroidia bacterium]
MSDTEPNSEPRSPCVSICVLDEDDICQGCYRNADEITDWFMSSDEQKREILVRCAQRMRQSNPIQLG